MTPIDRLQEAFDHPNVKAFLRVIRHGESNQTDDAYRLLFGGEKFNDFTRHPRKKLYAAKYGVHTTAAGAYQIIAGTWDGLVARYGFADFQPSTQDLAAIGLIEGRKALDDVKAGRFAEAVRKLGLEWASLPGSPYGQRTITLDKAKAVYEEWGGSYVDPAVVQPTEFNTGGETFQEPVAPAPQPFDAEAPQSYNSTKEPLDMNFLDLALAAVTAVVPELKTLYVDKGDTEKALLSQAVINIAKNVTAAKNEQEVAEAVRSPEAAQAVRTEIRKNWIELAEIGGGMEAAGKRSIAIAESGGGKKRLWQNPAWAFTLLVMPLIYFTVGAVVGNFGPEGMGSGNWTEEIRVMVVSSIISGVLGSLVGFWVGTSFSSSKKDDKLLR